MIDYYGSEATDTARNITTAIRVETRLLYVRMKDTAESPTPENQALVVEASTRLFELAARVRVAMVSIHDAMKEQTPDGV